MINKKKIPWLCLFILMFTMTSCGYGNKPASLPQEKLTLEQVIERSHQGQELSWEDFENYESTEIGSGLYILRYEIDENYYLLIGGTSPKREPSYIRLVNVSSNWVR